MTPGDDETKPTANHIDEGSKPEAKSASIDNNTDNNEHADVKSDMVTITCILLCYLISIRAFNLSK